MKHHRSIWVEDRPADWPTFEQLPPFLLEYRLVDILFRAFFLNAGMMLGSFLISPMLERIEQTSPTLATALDVLLLGGVIAILLRTPDCEDLDTNTHKEG